MPPLVAVVTRTRSPHTMGDDQPDPGISVFHATLEVELHSSGKSVSPEMPCPVGPRKRGQFSARAVQENTMSSNANTFGIHRGAVGSFRDRSDELFVPS